MLAKRKGVTARWGLKEAWMQNRDLTNRNRIQAVLVGRAVNDPRSPYPSRALNVDPAGVR